MTLDAHLWADLKSAWDKIVGAVPFDYLDGIKVRIHDGNYAVVRWREPDGMVAVADMRRVGIGAAARWIHEHQRVMKITEQQWHRLWIPENTDHLAVIL